jgi:hypothetical protein
MDFKMTERFEQNEIVNQRAKANYKDNDLPFDERADDLLSRMTINEKVVQLLGFWNGEISCIKDAILDINPLFIIGYELDYTTPK